MFLYQSFANKPVDSVTYVFYKQKEEFCLIIDPGTERDENLLNFLKNNCLKPQYIFLTHEHFDHILGVNFLREKFPEVKLCCSQLASERLPHSKKNLSIFFDQTNLVVEKADIFLSAGIFQFLNESIEIMETPGHTDSSLSFLIDEYFISGDFILQNDRVITNLPTGSKKQYVESVNNCSKYLEKKLILPGHGEAFYYQNISP